MASTRQFVPHFGCEPVRKNNVGITPPRHTVWSSPTPVADFLVKLYDPEAEYTAEDDVIQLHPPTVQHDQAVAEDPGCIDADLFNFDEHAFYEPTGMNPEQLMLDIVIDYSIHQLAQLYRINTLTGEGGPVWHDDDSPNAQLCRLYRPSELVHYLHQGQAVAQLSEEDVVYFSMKLTAAPSSVFICHWGSGNAAHYFTVGYNNATGSSAKHLYVTDSNIGGKKAAAVSRKFVAKFRALWNRIGHAPGVQLIVFYKDYSCEQQEDGKSCGFYAIHNAHRLVHAATIDGNFEQVGTGGSPFAVELGQLTPQKIRVWRAKVFKAYHEYQRQRALRTTFADNATIRTTPGYHPCHDFGSHRFKLTMTPQARAGIGYNGPGGHKLSEYQGLPYNPENLRKEKFNPDSEFARLVQDWKRDDVAGVIIRLSMSDEPSERAMYRAVGWGQTVLLSAYPVKARMSWKRPPKGTAASAQRPEEEVVQMCKAEFNALKEASLGLSEAQLRLQRDFIAGQMCQATPKLAICPNRDGTTWAKMAWRKSINDTERVQVQINKYDIVNTMQGAMRLGDYAMISLGGRPEVSSGNTAVPSSSGTSTLVPEAHYIWAGKWPHFGFGEDTWASVSLANIHPPDTYRHPEVWNWIPTSGVPSADFHRPISNAVFEELGNSQVHFGDDEVAHSNAVNLAMNYKWPPVTYEVPPLRSVNAVTTLFNRIGASKDLVTAAGPSAETSTTLATGGQDTGGSGGNDKNANTEPTDTVVATDGHESGKGGTGTQTEPPKKLRKVLAGHWGRMERTQPEKVVVLPSAAAKREKRAVINGWKHQDVFPPPKRLRATQSRVQFPSRMGIHADAYLTIGPSLSGDATADDPSRVHMKNKRKAYLASLLENMLGGENKGESGQSFHPGKGHFHHHHRPTKIINDHRWRVAYFTRVDADRFPWPSGVQKTPSVMMNVCEEVRERKQNKDPADAVEWRKFGHLLELGDKVTKLWESTPLKRRQSMRCLNGRCEQLRVSCLEFESKAVKDREWNLIERYQRWMYGAEQCPADCPLRAFDCPINCGLGGHNPINISTADYAALTDVNNLALTDAQKMYVVKVLDERYPSRWLGSPPIHWMPVRADPGFWDHTNQSTTALTARIKACESRLLEWEVLSDDERHAIMEILNIYYDDINDIIDNAAWVRKSRDAQRLAREEKEIREAYRGVVTPPPAISASVCLHLKRKTDRIPEDYPLSKRRYTIYGTWMRQLPKVTAVDFENKLTFKYLREFW